MFFILTPNLRLNPVLWGQDQEQTVTEGSIHDIKVMNNPFCSKQNGDLLLIHFFLRRL